MSRRNDRDLSYGLEKELSKSIESIRANIERNHKLRREIIKLRRQGKRPGVIPDEVREWYAEVDAMEEEEEE